MVLMKECNRCGIPIEYPKKYCEGCIPKAKKERQDHKRVRTRQYNRNRDVVYTRFYKSKEWRLLSQVYMTEQRYQCEQCKAIATDVHHKEPIQTGAGWHKRLDKNNLEALCVRCHNKAHGRFGN